MKNPAFNPMHPAEFRLRDDASPFAESITRFGAPAEDGLLGEALAIGHAPSIAAALGLVARMRETGGLAAATTGIRRRNLHRALGPGGNPTLDTLSRVTNAPGYRLSAARGGTPLGGVDSGV